MSEQLGGMTSLPGARGNQMKMPLFSCLHAFQVVMWRPWFRMPTATYSPSRSSSLIGRPETHRRLQRADRGWDAASGAPGPQLGDPLGPRAGLQAPSSGLPSLAFCWLPCTPRPSGVVCPHPEPVPCTDPHPLRDPLSQSSGEEARHCPTSSPAVSPCRPESHSGSSAPGLCCCPLSGEGGELSG